MELTKQFVDDYLARASFLGLLTLYYCSLMYSKKAAFDAKEFRKIRDGDYIYGFFVGCHCANILNYSPNGSIINIVEFNEYVSQIIRDRVIARANSYEKELPGSKWNDDITRIENLANNILTGQE